MSAKKGIDAIFKIGILIVAIAFVAVYFLSSQNDRYQQLEQKFGDISFCMLDTREGDIHVFYRDSEKGWEFYILNTENAKIKYKDVTLESIQPTDLD
jgi:hypothetical protein